MRELTPILSEHGVDDLLHFIERHPRLFVLTGAGCSTDSGIPDYRDSNGQWKHKQPVLYQDFVRSAYARQRYWARAMLGWRRFAQARPNTAHDALARLEAAGFVHQLVTQNVDGLHQRAGSRRVIDLHGRLDQVECLDCRTRWSRQVFQEELEKRNPEFLNYEATPAPDGDMRLEDVAFERFDIPACTQCGGLLKPWVAFYGETVPRPRVERAYQRLSEADALLVVGSSLMVYSGYRFCRAASEQHKPQAAINIGRTRGDHALLYKIAAPCGDTLQAVLDKLGIAG
ncbi:MAG: NAD-dependent protein deacetylase [Gammaproteobacteria bacterium]|nr:NAD-dependent protein deacetylase [Gammaproteobacteria bacterium]MCP5423594.1 NAD-dependent protein deacetylase [Gammaproteobacteria bacterium]MCP5459838.1 NAD-dependent protein deacetylase [Gammaproteobacteria bacterium]